MERRRRNRGKVSVTIGKVAGLFALLVNVKFLKEAKEAPPDVTSPTFNFRDVAGADVCRAAANESLCVFHRLRIRSKLIVTASKVQDVCRFLA